MKARTEDEALVREATLTGNARLWLAVMLLLFAVVYLGSAFSPALLDDADATHAEAAREMAATGDWVTLHVNGVRYLEKAPLMYWLVAASYRLFGANEFATRLPTNLAILLTALLAMRWATRAYGRRAGIYAGLFVSTGVGYYLFSRILIPEAILSLLIGAALYFFLSALDDSSAWKYYAFYACLGLAVLTKGLLAIFVICASLMSYLIVSGEWRRWREFRLIGGTILFLVIATPWHLIAGIRNPRFFWFYFVNEHFLRFLGKRVPRDYNKLPGSLYWSLHLVWLFPWSMYLPVAVRKLIQDWRSRGDRSLPEPPSFRRRTQILCWTWAILLLTFFAFSTNQEYYTYPVYLPVILLLAGAIAGEEEAGRRGWLVASTAVIAVLGMASAVVLGAGLWNSRHLPFVSDIGTVLAAPNLETNTLSMGHMLELTGPSFAALRLPAILATIALAIGPLAAIVLRLRRRHMASTLAVALTMTLFLTAAHIALVRFEPFLSSRSMAQPLQPRLQPNDRLMIYGDQAFGSSLLFYLRRPIELVNGNTTSMWWGSTYPDAPKIFLKDEDLVRYWNSPQRVFLFVPQHQRERVDELLPTKHPVIESSGKAIYCNQP